MSGRRLAAGIVVFGAERKRLRRLIEAAAPHVSVIFVFINGLLDEGSRSELADVRQVVLIDSKVNFGVGTALNILVLSAALADCSDLFVFDQDSRPGDELFPTVVGIADQLSSLELRPAAVAPRLVAPSVSSHKTPQYFRTGALQSTGRSFPVHYLPTSGSLISIDAFREIGPFRGDYFIDGIDLEWCFRAWSKGYSCWLATDVTMEHTVGEGAVEAFGFRTPRQKDFRLETYVRNTIYGFRLPHIPMSWKLRQAAYLAAQIAFLAVANRFRPSLLRRLGRGFLNGLRGRLGPPEGVPFT